VPSPAAAAKRKAADGQSRGPPKKKSKPASSFRPKKVIRTVLNTDFKRDSHFVSA
jgi:hypothetical protein